MTENGGLFFPWCTHSVCNFPTRREIIRREISSLPIMAQHLRVVLCSMAAMLVGSCGRWPLCTLHLGCQGRVCKLDTTPAETMVFQMVGKEPELLFPSCFFLWEGGKVEQGTKGKKRSGRKEEKRKGTRKREKKRREHKERRGKVKTKREKCVVYRSQLLGPWRQQPPSFYFTRQPHCPHWHRYNSVLTSVLQRALGRFGPWLIAKDMAGHMEQRKHQVIHTLCVWSLGPVF